MFVEDPTDYVSLEIFSELGLKIISGEFSLANFICGYSAFIILCGRTLVVQC